MFVHSSVEPKLKAFQESSLPKVGAICEEDSIRRKVLPSLRCCLESLFETECLLYRLLLILTQANGSTEAHSLHLVWLDQRLPPADVQCIVPQTSGFFTVTQGSSNRAPLFPKQNFVLALGRIFICVGFPHRYCISSYVRNAFPNSTPICPHRQLTPYQP